eukprot:2631789-Alexandrium_andersonii.AAC.1
MTPLSPPAPGVPKLTFHTVLLLMVVNAPSWGQNPPLLGGMCGPWARVRLHVAVSRKVTEPPPVPPPTWAGGSAVG